MNIEILNVDIFTVDADMIVNPVNCVGAMDEGLSAKFKELFPDNFEEYVLYCKYGLVYIGYPKYYFQQSRPRKVICNFPVKHHDSELSRMDYIYWGLSHVNKFCKSAKIESIAFPDLGYGAEGLDFELVIQVIKDTFAINTAANYPKKIIVTPPKAGV